MESKILADVRERLEKLNIFELRQVARAVGVHRPADGKKSRVTEAILDIAQGIAAPEPQSLRGAPPKSTQYDEQLVADIKTCREYYLALNGGQVVDEPSVISVADCCANEEGICKGYVYSDGEKSYILCENSAVFLHQSFVTRFLLRLGDLVECKVKGDISEGKAGVCSVISVNGKPCEFGAERRDFSQLTRIYPQTTVKTAEKTGDICCRISDMFAPLALGQRAFIVAPPRSGKTTLIKAVASGISQAFPQIEVIISLIGERPEEVTYFKRNFKDCKLFYTTFDMPPQSHIRTAQVSVEHAKRLTEEDKDVIVLFDGISNLIKAYPSEYDATDGINKLLYSACNAEEGGSLTLISTVSEGSAEYNKFTPLANMVIMLSGELAAKRIFPAIDVQRSFADGEERLLSSEELRAANALRKNTNVEIIEIFKQIQSNADVINKFKD